MQADVLGGMSGSWEAGPRSAAEFMEAAACFDRSATLSYAPALKTEKTMLADLCRRRGQAEAI